MSAINQIITTILDAFPNCQAIYLFGSIVTKYNTDKSDIDIAILLDHNEAKKIGDFKLSDIQQKLVSQLNKEVDLINLRMVSTVFQKEIITKGKCIFVKNVATKGEFEALTLSFYQKLNDERKQILKNYA